jgi:hypothetical protein
MRRWITLVCSLVVVVATAIPSSAQVETPAITYYTDDGVKVVALDGQELVSLEAFQFISLDGNVFAGSRHLSGGGLGEFIRAVDITTGTELFRIPRSFAPVVLADGRKIGFMPDRFARRDPYFSSVWIRTPQGKERKVVQFTGPDRTVPPTGFHGEGVPLDQAWDDLGRTLAVTFGNDVDLFIYDVWVVDVRTKEALRMTRGKVSRFPSLSPSGERLALVREVEHCGGPGPGYRAGNVRTMLTTGEEKRTLLEGSCEVFYTDPRWISEDELVAARLTQINPGDYGVDLVRVDATTGAVTELVTDGDVAFFSVSASLQVVAYARESVVPGFFVLDLETGITTPFDEGFIPQPSGVHRLV